MEKPYINVGIVTGKEISFTLNGKYLTQEGKVVTGHLKASATGNREISLGTKKIESIELTPYCPGNTDSKQMYVRNTFPTALRTYIFINRC